VTDNHDRHPGRALEAVAHHRVRADAGGTTIHLRFAAPDTEREREVAPTVAERYETMGGAFPSLVAQLEAELTGRLTNR